MWFWSKFTDHPHFAAPWLVWQSCLGAYYFNSFWARLHQRCSICYSLALCPKEQTWTEGNKTPKSKGRSALAPQHQQHGYVSYSAPFPPPHLLMQTQPKPCNETLSSSYRAQTFQIKARDSVAPNHCCQKQLSTDIQEHFPSETQPLDVT